jgi:hypothetical protein
LVRHAISNIVSIISRAIQELNRAVVWWTPDFIDKVRASQNRSSATHDNVDLGNKVMFGDPSSTGVERTTMRDGNLDL